MFFKIQINESNERSIDLKKTTRKITGFAKKIYRFWLARFQAVT